MSYGPWLEVNFSKPEWIRFTDVFEYKNKDGRHVPETFLAAFFNWGAASAIRLKASHPAYAMIASPPEPAVPVAPPVAPPQAGPVPAMPTLASLDARLRVVENRLGIPAPDPAGTASGR